MAEEIPKDGKCSCSKAEEAEDAVIVVPAEEPEKVEDCAPEDKIDGVCPPKKIVAPAVDSPVVGENVPAWAKALQTQISSISGIAEKLANLEIAAGVRNVPAPVSKVSSRRDEPFNLGKALEKVQKWIESDRTTSCSIEIPVDTLRSFNIKKVKTASGVRESYRNSFDSEMKIKEALGYTGTMSTPEEDTDVAMEPGAASFVPVTQFAKFKEVQKGNNAARFFKADLPATATQTPGTTATVGTMDIESVTVTPSTITGVHLEIDTDDIEDNPFDTVGTVVKHSAARFDDFIATDMLDTVSAQGTLTPLAWLRASDGAVVTTSDAASITFDPTGIAAGVRVLENQGLLKGGAKPVCFLHPQQFQELVEDSELTNYVQYAKPEITQNYQMAELYGCTLVRTNAVQNMTAQTNAAYNAIMCVPQHSYGVASKRTVNVKFHEVPEDNQIWATTNWRIKSGVIDANSIVRISSTQ